MWDDNYYNYTAGQHYWQSKSLSMLISENFAEKLQQYL